MTTPDPTLAQIHLTASVSGTEEIKALAKNIDNVSAAEDKLAASQENVSRKGATYLAYLARVEAAQNKTREEIMRATAQQRGVGPQAEPIIQSIVNKNEAQKQMQVLADLEAQRAAFRNNLTQQYTNRTQRPSELLAARAEELGITQETEKMRHALVQAGIDGEHSFKHMIASGGVFRELIILIHESLIMGNWSRFGGSLMVLTERAGLSSAVFTAMGVSILGAAGAVAALTGAMIEGEIQSTAYARAMSLTGGIAGITEGQFNDMAESIGNQIPGSVLKARSALLDLVKTGQFSGDTLASVGRAATEFSKYSGEDAKQSAEYFASMKDGVAKWAAKADEQYHFLTAAQYDYIASLERMGQTEAAEKAVADDFFNHIQQTGTENLGYLERAINSVTNSFRDMWDGMENWGRTLTDQDQLNSLIEKRNELKSRPDSVQLDAVNTAFENSNPELVSPGTDNSVQGQIEALNKQISALQAKIATGIANKKASAAAQEVQDKGTAASQLLNGQDAAPVDAYTTWKNGYDQAIAAVLKADRANPKGPQSDPEYQKWQGLSEHNAAYQQELTRKKKELDGSAPTPKNSIPLDDTSRLQTQLSIMEQYARATHQSETAVLRLEIAQGKLSGFTKAQIKQLSDMAHRHDDMVSAEDQSELDTRFTGKNNDLLLDNARLKQQLAQLKATGKTTDPTDLDQVNLEVSRGDLVGLSPAEIQQLRDAATGDDKLNQQIAATQRTSSYGTENAFATYVDDATNAGAQVERVWSDTFSGMQDMLTRVLEGGKVNFRDFSVSVVDDLLQMEVQENIMGPLVKLLGGAGGGKDGSGFGSLLGDLGGDLSHVGADLFGSSKGGPGIISEGAKWLGTGLSSLGSSLFGPSKAGSGIISEAENWLGSFKFANGGIMTARGSIPLNKYANGGIANSPQMAIFGEGRGPEAYVPLPDGRSIPVTMRGGSGGGSDNSVTNHITINSDGSTQVSPESGKRMAQAITYAVQQEMIRQAQDGGILSSTGGVFRGGAFQ